MKRGYFSGTSMTLEPFAKGLILGHLLTDVRFYVEELHVTGWRTGLQWYRLLSSKRLK